jgi:hypothetical protein
MWFLGIALLLLGLNWIAAIGRFQVDVLYWDQWGFFTPIMEGRGWWGIFDWQHGPHRQGLGFLLTSWIMASCSWDQRINSLWILGVLLLAAVSALMLKRRLAGPLEAKDAWIALAILALNQCDTVITTPNVSHSVFPLLLMLVLAHLWLSENIALRYIGGALCTAFLMFTGFGIFTALVSTLFVAIAAVAEFSGRRVSSGFMALGSLAFMAISWAVFCHGYVFDPASPGFRFPWSPLTEYPKFLLLMLTAPAGWQDATSFHYLAGVLCSVTLLAAMFSAARSFIRAPTLASADAVLLLIGLSTVLFCANTAVGRIQGGVDGGLTSRYVTLVTPAWLVIYLWSRRSSSPWRTPVHAGLLAIVAYPYLCLWNRPPVQWPGSLGASNGIYRRMQDIEDQKLAFVLTYLREDNLRHAVEISKATVFPKDGLDYLDKRMLFLKEHRLSFFGDSETPLGFAPWFVDDYSRWLSAFDPEGHARWLGAGAELELAAKKERYLNFKVLGRAPALPAQSVLTVGVGDDHAAIGNEAGSRGVSLAVAPGEYRVKFESPGGAFSPGSDDSRKLSFFISEPELSRNPQYVPWLPAAGGRALAPAYDLEIISGFYGWENGGAFGWMSETLTLSATASVPAYLNVVIAKRAESLPVGPVIVSLDGIRRELELGPGGLRISVPLSPGREPHRVSIENATGAAKPRQDGKSPDTRALALRLDGLAIAEAPITQPLVLH